MNKKEQGNALFKKGLFEQALVIYSEALKMCSEDDRQIKKLLNAINK